MQLLPCCRYRFIYPHMALKSLLIHIKSILLNFYYFRVMLVCSRRFSNPKPHISMQVHTITVLQTIDSVVLATNTNMHVTAARNLHYLKRKSFIQHFNIRVFFNILYNTQSVSQTDISLRSHTLFCSGVSAEVVRGLSRGLFLLRVLREAPQNVCMRKISPKRHTLITALAVHTGSLTAMNTQIVL